jgi:SAM-dependent methyltransferase
MDLADESVDVIIASHTIHHFYSPYKFFMECQRVLKKGGIVIIQEINTSFFMRLLLRIMRHEGWSYDVDVFDPNAIVNDANDLWSANCAVPELLFYNSRTFERTFPELQVTRNKCCEFLLFPLSGGVIAKTSIPELPAIVLRGVMVVDAILTKIAPSIFALGRQIVVQRYS